MSNIHNTLVTSTTTHIGLKCNVRSNRLCQSLTVTSFTIHVANLHHSAVQTTHQHVTDRQTDKVT